MKKLGIDTGEQESAAVFGAANGSVARRTAGCG
jgi:hypothetical protein